MYLMYLYMYIKRCNSTYIHIQHVYKCIFLPEEEGQKGSACSEEMSILGLFCITLMIITMMMIMMVMMVMMVMMMIMMIMIMMMMIMMMFN
jgi:hypothetical protein